MVSRSETVHVGAVATVNWRSRNRLLDSLPPEALPDFRSELADGTLEIRREETDGAPDIAEIVHDLKNPLSTIALEMVLLDEALATEGQAELRKAIRRVNHNIDYIDRMVQDLLDSCAIASGELVIERRKTELRSLLEHVIDRAVPTRDRMRVSLEAPAPMLVAIDGLRIERVVANLLSNALKYAPRASGIVVRLEALPGFACVSIADSGPGMTAEETTHVFDKYWRTPRAHTYEGNGLGLHVSKKIVEAHGGTIGVDSVDGLGSRFFFELPTT